MSNLNLKQDKRPNKNQPHGSDNKSTRRDVIVYPGACKKINNTTNIGNKGYNIDENNNNNILNNNQDENNGNIHIINARYINHNNLNHYNNSDLRSNINKSDHSSVSNNHSPYNNNFNTDCNTNPLETNHHSELSADGQIDKPSLLLKDKSFVLDWIDTRKIQSDSTRTGTSQTSTTTSSVASRSHRYLSSNQLSNTTQQANSKSKFPFSITDYRKNYYSNHSKGGRLLRRDEVVNKKMQSATESKIQENPASGLVANDSETILFELNSDESFGYFENQELEGQLGGGQNDYSKRGLGSGGHNDVPYDYNQLDEPILDTILRDLGGIYEKMKIIAIPISSYDIYKIVLRGWDLWGPLLLCTFLAFNLHNDDTINNSNSGSRHTIGPHFADVFVLIWFGSGLVSLNYRLLSLSSVNNESIQMFVHGDNTSEIPSTSSTNNNNNNNQQHKTNQRRNDGMKIISSDNQSEVGFKRKSDGSVSSSMIPLPEGDGDGGRVTREDSMKLLISPPSILQLMCVFGYCLVAPSVGLIILKFVSLTNSMIERMIIGLLFGFVWPTFSAVKILQRYQHPEKRALSIYPMGLFYFILGCMIILNH